MNGGSDFAFNELTKPDAIMESNVLKHLKTFIGSAGQHKVPQAIQAIASSYVGFAEMGNLVQEWLSRHLDDFSKLETSIQERLRDLVVSRFDPVKADELFKSSGAAPIWLEHLCTHPLWRSTFFQLSDQFPNCLLLKFAVQKMSQEGLTPNLIDGASSLPHFDTFHSSLMENIKSVLQSTEETYTHHMETLKSLVCPSEYTFLYAQRILLDLSSGPLFFAYQRIAQDLSQTRETRIREQLLLVHKYPDLFKALKSLHRMHRILPIDAENLHKLYTSNSPPPLELLRTPRMIQALTQSLFDYKTPPKGKQKDHFIYLLALLGSPGNPKVSQLDKVNTLCQSKDFAIHIEEISQSLSEFIPSALHSHCILSWIASILLDSNYFETTYHTSCTPFLLQMLCSIASIHHRLRQRCLRLIEQCIDISVPLDAVLVVAYHKQLIKVLVHLVHLGMVQSVFKAVSRMIGRWDHALIRDFVVSLLSSIQNPSEDFMVMLKVLLKHPSAKTALSSHQNSMKVVKEFFT